MSSIDETTKRGLRKPQPTDYVDVVADINDNMDNLDDAVPDSRKVNGHPLTADVTITKSDVGLGNVDNTADADKPISTAMSTALDGKVSTSSIGAANGVAGLDANGRVPSGQLPIEIATVAETQAMMDEYDGGDA